MNFHLFSNDDVAVMIGFLRTSWFSLLFLFYL